MIEFVESEYLLDSVLEMTKDLPMSLANKRNADKVSKLREVLWLTVIVVIVVVVRPVHFLFGYCKIILF